jgi:uncharacterized protein (DUF1501 family)
MTRNISRRRFLNLALKYSVMGAAAPLALNLASIRAASAANTSGQYKALVCVFLYGGNDAHNTIVPYDLATYKKYADIRAGLAVPRQNLSTTIITPTSGWGQGHQFALHPMLAPLKTLFDDGKLVPVMNVGALLRPTTLADYKSKRNLPSKLMSHNDQFSFWQSMLSEGASTGWGGRLGDLLASSNLDNSQLTNISVGSPAIFSSGKKNSEFTVDPSGIQSIKDIQGLQGSAQIISDRLLQNNQHLFVNELAKRYKTAVVGSKLLADSPAFSTFIPNFPQTELGIQLAMVAKIIAANQDLSMKRQVFFVSMGGFDHHSGLVVKHPPLLQALANSMSAFQNAMDGLGLGSQVTTFTASDFGRSFVPNGDGTDHGWGGHHFVMGGAVKSKAWVGALPAFTLKGPDDIGSGRLLPAISVDQYMATLARWMGVTDSELPTIFPNIINFSTKNLGFMA